MQLKSVHFRHHQAHYAAQTLLVSLVGLLACPLLYAEDPANASKQTSDLQQCPFSAALEREDLPYAEKAGNMLVRGALNAGFGWTEMLILPAKEMQTSGDIIGGLTKGLGYSFFRTLSGVGEVVTFWAPRINGEYIKFANDSPLDMHNEPIADKKTTHPGVDPASQN